MSLPILNCWAIDESRNIRGNCLVKDSTPLEDRWIDTAVMAYSISDFRTVGFKWYLPKSTLSLLHLQGFSGRGSTGAVTYVDFVESTLGAAAFFCENCVGVPPSFFMLAYFFWWIFPLWWLLISWRPILDNWMVLQHNIHLAVDLSDGFFLSQVYHSGYVAGLSHSWLKYVLLMSPMNYLIIQKSKITFFMISFDVPFKLNWHAAVWFFNFTNSMTPDSPKYWANLAILLAWQVQSDIPSKFC